MFLSALFTFFLHDFDGLPKVYQVSQGNFYVSATSFSFYGDTETSLEMYLHLGLVC